MNSDQRIDLQATCTCDC